MLHALCKLDDAVAGIEQVAKEVSSKYNSLNEIHSPGKYDYKGVSKRSAFVIGKDGKIKYAEICEHTGLQPDYEAIKNSLKNN